VLFRKTKTRRTRASARREVRVDRRVDPWSRAVTNAAFACALAETASRFANHFTKRLRHRFLDWPRSTKKLEEAECSE
jgi:hypothetical protein